MSGRKTTVHRSEHLRVYKFVSFTSVIIYTWTLITPSLLFQFAKRNEKVMPPCMYWILPVIPLLSCCHFLLCPPPLIFQPPPPPLHVIIFAQSLIWIEIERTHIHFSREVFVPSPSWHQIGPWRGIIYGRAYPRMYVFCLQVDRSITGGAYKWEFTVNRSLSNVCAKYTKRINCYTICQTVYWILWWENAL